MASADSIFWARCRRCGEGLGPFASWLETERAEVCEACDEEEGRIEPTAPERAYKASGLGPRGKMKRFMEDR